MSIQRSYDNRLVAYIDILGWTSAINELPASRLFELLEPIRELGDFYNKNTRNKMLQDYNAVNPIMKEIQFCFLSDCLIISTPIDLGGRIYDRISDLIHKFLSEGFAVRGGVSCGEVFHEDQLIFGPALIDAYQIELKRAKYPRVLIDDKAISATGLKSTSIIKDHLDNWIINPFPSCFSMGNNKDMINQLFNIETIILQIQQKLSKHVNDGDLIDIWRYQSNLCAISLKKYHSSELECWIKEFERLALI